MDRQEIILEKLKSEKECHFFLKNKDNSFQVTYVVIDKKEEEYFLHIYYSISCFDNSNELCFHHPTPFKTHAEILSALYEVAWEYKLCSECFELVTPEKSICDRCLPQQYFWDYGLKHQKTETIPTCSICFDNVYGSVLECGHYFHVTCLRNLYRAKKNVHCPNCRKVLSAIDRKNFFLE